VTEDGTYGKKGFVTDVLEELLDRIVLMQFILVDRNL